MTFLLEHTWIWLLFALIISCAGFVWYQQRPVILRMIIVCILPVLTYCTGLGLYYGTTTDKKTIRQTVAALADALENDDLETIDKYFAPSATQGPMFAKKLVRNRLISRASYRHLKIEINDATSPPVAKIEVTALFSFKDRFYNKYDIRVYKPNFGKIQIEAEFEKTRFNTWLITDNYRWYSWHGPVNY